MEQAHEFYLRTTPERLCEAITVAEIRSRCSLVVRSAWTGDARLEISAPTAPRLLAEGLAGNR